LRKKEYVMNTPEANEDGTEVLDPVDESSDQTGESNEDEQVEEKPSYITMEAFEAAMTEQGRSVNDAINNLTGQLQGLTGKLEKNRQPVNEPSPVVPTAEEFAERVGTWKDFQGVLANLHDKLDEKIAKISDKFEQSEQTQAEEKRVNTMYDFIVGEMKQASSKFEVFKNPEAENMLRDKVTAALHKNGGDISKISIPAITKQVNTIINGFKTPAQVSRIQPNQSTSNSVTKPVFPDMDPNKDYSISELDKMLDSSLGDLAELYQKTQEE
jgi:hypothetical protein